MIQRRHWLSTGFHQRFFSTSNAAAIVPSYRRRRCLFNGTRAPTIAFRIDCDQTRHNLIARAVPGSDERKLMKSASLSADALVLDLEDGVPLARKADARRLVAEALRVRVISMIYGI